MVFWLPARSFHFFLGAGDSGHLCLIQNRWQLLQTGVQHFPSLTFNFSSGVAAVGAVGVGGVDFAIIGDVEFVSIRQCVAEWHCFDTWESMSSVKRNTCQEHISQALNPSPTMSEILPHGRPLQPNTAVQISIVCVIPMLSSTIPGFIFWPKCTAASLTLSNDFPVSFKYTYL